MISDLIQFLKGRTRGVVKLFKSEMEKASTEKNFETAAVLRDRIKDIAAMTESQRVVSPKKDNVDVIGTFGEKNQWVISLLMIRDGKLIDIKNILMKGIKTDGQNELIKRFIVDYYDRTFDFPREIYLPVD